MTSLTVIVPATNNPSTIESCLASIHAARGCPEEVLVVSEPAHSGPAGARNLGAEQATGDVLVFIDADVSIHSDSLERIKAAFEANPALTAVFGSYDDSPTAPGLVSKFRNLLHHHLHQQSPGRAFTFWAGLGAVRRSDFCAIGGFDVNRFPQPSVEDIDLGMRLSSQGALIILDPDLQCSHHKSWTIREMIRTDFKYRGAPWVALLIRQKRLGDKWQTTVLNLAWLHRLSALCSGVFVAGLIAREPPVWVPALVALLGLNRSFYRLLLRRVGPARLAPCIALHIIHHMTCAAAVPAGISAYLLEKRRKGELTPVE